MFSVFTVIGINARMEADSIVITASSAQDAENKAYKHLEEVFDVVEHIDTPFLNDNDRGWMFIYQYPCGRQAYGVVHAPSLKVAVAMDRAHSLNDPDGSRIWGIYGDTHPAYTPI